MRERRLPKVEDLGSLHEKTGGLADKHVGLGPLAILNEGADAGELGLGGIIPAGRSKDSVLELSPSGNLREKRKGQRLAAV